MNMRKTVATTFLELIKEYVGDENYAEICARNSAEQSLYICHTHDFCDANVFMAAAMHVHGLCTAVDITEEDDKVIIGHERFLCARDEATAFWNETWDWAAEMTGRKGMSDKQIEELADQALNAACVVMQKALGVTDGDFASFYFGGKDPCKFEDYIRQELMNKKGKR